MSPCTVHPHAEHPPRADHQVRACLNSWLEATRLSVSADHALQLFRLRQARAMLMWWKHLGHNLRAMLVVGQRTLQMSVLRAYNGWLSTWRHCITVERRSMNIALGAAARFIQYGVCRAYGAMKTKWATRLRHVATFRRIVYPKLGRCLNSWHLLASRQVRQLGQLRRALVTIQAGIVVRCLTAWHTVVAHNKIVMGHVASVIGRMAQNVLWRWARYTSRRVACRAAEHAMLPIRRAVVCHPMLLTWTVAQRFTSMNGAALGHAFARTARLVFDGWYEVLCDAKALRARQRALSAAPAAVAAMSRLACYRWRFARLSFAFEMWADKGLSWAVAETRMMMALGHSAKQLARWAFSGYRYAVRLCLLERAAI
jgi:hypothetical protein